MEPSDSTLRDSLAVERTRLANERTLLAYLRTAIMLAATGATLITLYSEMPSRVVAGWLLITSSVAAAIIGIKRFRRVADRLSHH